MMRSVYTRTLYEKRWFILGWTLGFMALAALMASFFPAMRQDGAFDSLVQNMPPAFKGLIGDLALLNEFPTYLASQLFDIRVPMIAGIMAIILGLSLSVADEERGELRSLLSLPISRVTLFTQRWLAMTTVVAITSLGLVIGVYAVVPFIPDAYLPVETMAQLMTMTLLLMITFGTIPFAVGYLTGRRAVAAFSAIVVIIGSFLLSTFSAAVDWLRDYEIMSLLHYFPAVEVAQGRPGVIDMVLYGVIIVLLLLVSGTVFRHRDIQ